jgi:hypothetical protein
MIAIIIIAIILFIIIMCTFNIHEGMTTIPDTSIATLSESYNGTKLSVATAQITSLTVNGTNNFLPSGIIIAFYGASNALNIPVGWTLCDGTHGAPDLRGKFILAASSNHALGTTDGEETHTLTTAEIPSHSHTIGMTVQGDPTQDGNVRGSGSDLPIQTLTQTGSTGGNSAHNNMPPFHILAYIMKL